MLTPNSNGARSAASWRRRLAALALTVASTAACLPAATFTTARPVARGRFEHVASLEVVGAQYRGTSETTSEPLDENGAGVVPAYSLRYGVARRFELGAKLSPFTFELNAKTTLVDARRFALALAPRIGSMDVAPFVPPYVGRLPILATFGPFAFVSFTPRVGIGYVLGTAHIVPDTSVPLHHPLLEGGLTVMFRLTDGLSLAADASILRTFLNGDVFLPGGGLGLVFTPRSK